MSADYQIAWPWGTLFNPGQWADQIAGGYFALWLTLLVGVVVTYSDYLEKKNDMSNHVVRILFLAMALTSFGHLFDQSLWTISNIERAIRGQSAHTYMSGWYLANIPIVPVAAKFTASLGVMMAMWVARGARVGISLRSWMLCGSVMWIATVEIVAALT